mmetsp:Transcript_56405/g.111988  ORF Transcript_56405/g.111988 Transcript_56405/m.111988 type:complete len:95 (-) Transcript_56405:518-802(-)
MIGIVGITLTLSAISISRWHRQRSRRRAGGVCDEPCGGPAAWQLAAHDAACHSAARESAMSEPAGFGPAALSCAERSAAHKVAACQLAGSVTML